ncbi:uncharacterized protein LOC120343153 [Styela clava]
MSRQDSNPGVNSNVNNNVIEKSLKPNVPSKPHHLQPGTKASLSKDNITPKGWSRQTNFTFDAKNVETADKSITQPESMFSPKWRPVPRVSKKQNKREDIKTKDYNANQELSSPTTGHKSLSRPHSKSPLLEEEQQPGFGSLKRMWSQKTKDGDKLPGLSSPPTLRTQAKEREHSPLSKNNSVDKSTSSDKTDSPQSLSRSESSSSNGSVRTASFKDRAHGSWHCVISHSPTNTGSGFLSEAFPSQIPPNEPAVTESSRNKKFDHSILMPRPFRTSAIDEESTFTSVRAVKSQSSNHHTPSKQISPITERKEVRRPSSSLSDDSNTSPAEELDSDEREMRQARKLGTRVTRFDGDGNMYSVDPRTGKVEYVDKNITNERIPEAIYSDSPFVDSSKTNILHRGKITLENAGKRNGSDRNSHRSLHSNQRSHESSSDEAPPPLLPRERGSRHARSRAPLVSSLSGGRQSSLTSYSMYPPKNRGSRYATSTRTDYGGISPDSAVPPPIMPRGEQMPAISQDYTPMSASGSDNPFPGLRTRTSTSSLNSFLDQAGPAYEPMDASGSYEPMEPKDEDEMFCYSAAVDPAKPRLSLREYHEIDPDPDVPVGQLTTTVVYDPGLVPPPPDCDPPTLPEGVTRTHSRSKSHPNPPGSPPPLPPLNPNTGAQKKLNYIEVEIGTAMSSRDVEAKRKSQKTNYTEVIIGGGPVVSGKDDGDGKKGKSVKGKLMSMFSSKHHDGYLSEGDVISHKNTDDERMTDFTKERNKLKRLSGRLLRKNKSKHKSRDYSHQSSVEQESSYSSHHAINNNKELENVAVAVYGSATNLSTTSSESTRSLSHLASSNSGSSGDGQARFHHSQGTSGSIHPNADRRQSHEPHRALPPKLDKKSRSEVQLNVEMNLPKTNNSKQQNNESHAYSKSVDNTQSNDYQAARSGQGYGGSPKISAPRVQSHLHQQRGTRTKVLPTSPRPVSEPPLGPENSGSNPNLSRPLSTPYDTESLRRSPRPDMVKILPLPIITDNSSTDQEQLSPNFPLVSPPSPPPLDSLPPCPVPDASGDMPPAPMRDLKPDRFKKQQRVSRDLSSSDTDYTAAQDIPTVGIDAGNSNDPIYDDVEFDDNLGIHSKTPLSASSKSKLLESEPLYQVYRSRTLTHASVRNRHNATAQRRRFKTATTAPTERRSDDVWQSDLMTDDAGSTTLWKEVKEVVESGIGINLTNDEMKLQQAQFEVVTSQASYMRSLNILIDHFSRDSSMENSDILPKKQRKELFSNIIAVQEVERRFLQDIEQHFWAKLYLTDIAKLTAQYATSEFEVYVRYVQNQVYQDRVLTDLQRSNEKFAEELARLESSPFCNKLPLLSFLLLPMQRVTRLPLLISAIVNQADSAGDKIAYAAAKQALAVVNKLVKKCNEGARKMQQTEQLAETARELCFAPKVKTYALVSQSRSVVKKGEMTVTMAQENKKSKVMKLWLFLFSDVLLLARKKNFLEAGTNIKYEVIDWAKRAMLYANERAVSDNEIFLVLLENCVGKRVELTLTPTSQNELSRWTDALNPQRIDESEDSIYESWDCPQYTCIVPYAAQQPDEISLDVGDVMRVLKKTGDGWLEGERLRDNEQGWFPAENCEEIEDEHVRARNLRNLYRIIPAGGSQE